jgi:hypothetical protein
MDKELKTSSRVENEVLAIEPDGNVKRSLPSKKDSHDSNEKESSSNEDWGRDYSRDEEQEKKGIKEGKKVSPQEKLTFAKRILIFLFIVYVVITALALLKSEYLIEKIWIFTAGAIVNLVGILIGYYFTTNKK